MERMLMFLLFSGLASSFISAVAIKSSVASRSRSSRAAISKHKLERALLPHYSKKPVLMEMEMNPTKKEKEKETVSISRAATRTAAGSATGTTLGGGSATGGELYSRSRIEITLEPPRGAGKKKTSKILEKGSLFSKDVTHTNAAKKFEGVIKSFSKVGETIVTKKKDEFKILKDEFTIVEIHKTAQVAHLLGPKDSNCGEIVQNFKNFGDDGERKKTLTNMARPVGTLVETWLKQTCSRTPKQPQVSEYFATNANCFNFEANVGLSGEKYRLMKHPIPGKGNAQKTACVRPMGPSGNPTTDDIDIEAESASLALKELIDYKPSRVPRWGPPEIPEQMTLTDAQGNFRKCTEQELNEKKCKDVFPVSPVLLHNSGTGAGGGLKVYPLQAEEKSLADFTPEWKNAYKKAKADTRGSSAVVSGISLVKNKIVDTKIGTNPKEFGGLGIQRVAIAWREHEDGDYPLAIITWYTEVRLRGSLSYKGPQLRTFGKAIVAAGYTHAINLDGSGSAQQVYNTNKVPVNLCADDSQQQKYPVSCPRPVPNALLFYTSN